MGTADIIPGVSGNGCGFITGIYERLLAALSAIVSASTLHLLKGDVRSFWKGIDGTFSTLFVFGNIAGDFQSLNPDKLAATHLASSGVVFVPLGLICASIWHIGRQIKGLGMANADPVFWEAISAVWHHHFPFAQLLPPSAENFFFGICRHLCDDLTLESLSLSCCLGFIDACTSWIYPSWSSLLVGVSWSFDDVQSAYLGF